MHDHAHAQAPTCPCGAAARVRRQPFSVQPRIERRAAAADVGRAARLGHRFRSPTSAELAPAGAGRPLPEPLRERMETAFGHDFSSVRVHEDAKAASVRAVAFTRGENIHFRPGRFQTAGRAGSELLAHELAHVVQQRQGRVAAPPAEAPVQEVPELEGEAERAGRAAARGARVAAAPAGGGAARAAGGGAAQPAVQRDDDDELFEQWNYYLPDTSAAFGFPGVRKKGELIPYRGAKTHGLGSDIPVKLYDHADRSSASGKLGANALDVINSSDWRSPSWRSNDLGGHDVVQSWSGYQSQHVLPYQHLTHPLLSKLDVNTEFPLNNMFLPEPSTTEGWGGTTSAINPHSFYSDPGKGKTTGAPHLGYHSWYNKYVGKQIGAIESHVASGSNSDAERELELYKLQRSLRVGQEAGLPFYPLQSFSGGRKTFIGHDLPGSYDASVGGGFPRLDLELVGDKYASAKDKSGAAKKKSTREKAGTMLEDVWKKTLKTLPRSKDRLPVGLL
jgi:hypothetical protein